MPTIEQSTSLVGSGLDLARADLLSGKPNVLAWGASDLTWGAPFIGWGAERGVSSSAILISNGLTLTRATAFS